MGSGNTFTYSSTISGVTTIDLVSGELVLGTGGSIAGRLTFDGAATIELATGTNQINGIIAGAVTGDAIDLRFQAFASGDQAVWVQNNDTAGTLKLETSGGTVLDTLILSGQYASVQFSVVTDNNGGTLIDVAAHSPPPPGGTTAVMIMNNPSNGDYEIYDIGGNAILAAYLLGQVAHLVTFVGLGTFQAGDTSDMLLRNTSTGAFEAYYISGNTITGAALVGTVGTNWNFAGTGDFDGASSLSEMLLRNAGSGSFELYQVAGGGVLSGSSVAAVGNNFSVAGFGNFSESGTTQMMMEDKSERPARRQARIGCTPINPAAAAFAGIVVGAVGSNLSSSAAPICWAMVRPRW